MIKNIFLLLSLLSPLANAGDVASSGVYPGTIFPFAGATCPAGTLSANGASLLRAGKYAPLFSAIGTTWGAADGTHFSVPNLINRVLRGAGAATDGNGGTTVNLGAYQEAATRIYTAITSGSESASHTHTESGHTHVQNVMALGGGSLVGFSSSGGLQAPTPTDQRTGFTAVSLGIETFLHTHTVATGQGDTETRTKAYGVNYCIKY